MIKIFTTNENGKIELTKEELQKMDLDASKADIAKQKEIYAKANPAQLESMERKLQGKQEEYDQC